MCLKIFQFCRSKKQKAKHLSTLFLHNKSLAHSASLTLAFASRKFIFFIQIYSHPKYMTKNAGKIQMETNFLNGFYL